MQDAVCNGSGIGQLVGKQLFDGWLVKLAAGLLILLLLIPMLVFTALPNIFFGYDSSTTPEIMDVAGADALAVCHHRVEQGRPVFFLLGEAQLVQRLPL